MHNPQHCSSCRAPLYDGFEHPHNQCVGCQEHATKPETQELTTAWDDASECVRVHVKPCPTNGYGLRVVDCWPKGASRQATLEDCDGAVARIKAYDPRTQSKRRNVTGTVHLIDGVLCFKGQHTGDYEMQRARQALEASIPRRHLDRLCSDGQWRPEGYYTAYQANEAVGGGRSLTIGDRVVRAFAAPGTEFKAQSRHGYGPATYRFRPDPAPATP